MRVFSKAFAAGTPLGTYIILKNQKDLNVHLPVPDVPFCLLSSNGRRQGIRSGLVLTM